MSETFDSAATNPAAGGENLAGDRFSQAGVSLFLPASYLVFGPANGPYTRVEAGAGLPVALQNATLAVTQSGAWSVSVGNTVTVSASNLDIRDLSFSQDSISAVQSGDWTVLAVQSGAWSASVTGTVAISGTPTVNALQSGSWTVGTELPTAGNLTDSMAGPTTPSVGALLMAFNGSSWFRLRGDTTNGILVQGAVTADTELPTAAALADGLTNPTTPTVGAAELLFNGSTWDRRPGTQEGTLLSSATRNTTTDSATQTNYGAKGVLLTMNITATAGTGVKLEIRGVDPILGGDIILARHSTLRYGTAQVHWLELHPGAASASIDGWGERFQGCLPRRWKLRVLHSDANNLTYSVGYTLLP